MSDTFHIKRFEEHGRYYDQDGFEYVVEQAHNDLAHHTEQEQEQRQEDFNTLEERLDRFMEAAMESEKILHERNNQLEEKLLKEEESIAKHTFELECRINVLEKRIEELEHKSIPLADKIGLICPDCGAKYPASSFQSIDGTSKIWEARCSCGHEFSPPQRRE